MTPWLQRDSTCVMKFSGKRNCEYGGMLKEKNWRKTERLNLQVFLLKNRITLGFCFTT